MSFLATLNEEGSYDLTTAGYVIFIVIMIAVLLLGTFLINKNHKFDAKKLAFSAIAIALATVTSNIKLVHMPFGGSVTLLSMLFVTLIGYWFGLAAGLTSAFAYGILQLVMGPYIISIPQLLIDYIFAFTSLGLSGLFHMKKMIFVNEKTGKSHTISGLIPGYTVAVLARLFFSTLSGVIFFGTYAPENFPNPTVYSLIYNGSYMGLEAILTLIIISIPPVAAALNHVKNLAVGNTANSAASAN
ncbi:MAG: energy-coupled thiamine transporter ThiT [Lachnospiraceae bacterium]|nr:energy-coupled thiamine transporter ThiT [Lachnospiraceae bacterium]